MEGANDLLSLARSRSRAPSRLGRLPKDLKIDEEQIEMCAQVGLVQEEIAALAGVSRSTLNKRLKENPTLLRAHARGAGGLRMSLKRELVYQALVLGNFSALQFALRNICGWSTHGEARPQNIEVFEAEMVAAGVAERTKAIAGLMKESAKAWRNNFGVMEAIEAGEGTEQFAAPAK